MARIINFIFITSLFFLLSNVTSSIELTSDEDVIFNFIDLDNDDKISSLEINQSMNIVFQLADIDRDGFITKTELIGLKKIIESLK